VVDTGIGMSEEECGRLFREFVRIKNSKTRDILGSGLGLSIVRRISALYQGTVSVHSTPDVGTTFEVVLAGAESLPAPT
jgi:signal transduction histidine kinase